MQRNFIMENDPNWEGIPKELKAILARRFTDNRVYMYGVSENIKKDPSFLIRLLNDIQTGDTMIGQTNFHEDDQVEKLTLMLVQLMKMSKRIKCYFVLDTEVYGTMEAALGKYIARPVAFDTPEGYDRHTYKQMVNAFLKDALDWHDIYSMMSADPIEDVRMEWIDVIMAAPSMAS